MISTHQEANMGNDDDETRRLERLRDRQVAGRDARAKADRRRAHALGSRPRQKLSLAQEIQNMPAKYTWPFIGAPIGLGLGMFIGWLIEATAHLNNAYEVMTLLGAFLGGFIAFALGRVRDSGREDWK
jgi:hypothetical protein